MTLDRASRAEAEAVARRLERGVSQPVGTVRTHR
jgi:hypothetical protein